MFNFVNWQRSLSLEFIVTAKIIRKGDKKILLNSLIFHENNYLITNLIPRKFDLTLIVTTNSH